MALHYMREVLNEYNAALKAADYGYRETGGAYTEAELAELAKIILNRFEQVNDLSCIMHGEDRVRGSIQPGRFGVYEEDVRDYRARI